MDSAKEMLTNKTFRVGPNMNSSSFVVLNICVQRNGATSSPEHDLHHKFVTIIDLTGRQF